jgi:hypothetical protein
MKSGSEARRRKCLELRAQPQEKEKLDWEGKGGEATNWVAREGARRFWDQASRVVATSEEA